MFAFKLTTGTTKAVRNVILLWLSQHEEVANLHLRQLLTQLQTYTLQFSPLTFFGI
jgi:hypothetical protein